jgi:hypothetical protein
MRIEFDKLARLLVSIPIGNDIERVVVDNTPVGIVQGRISRDLVQLVRLHVQEVLPGMDSIITSWGTPFDEEYLVRIWDVAGGFVGLVS